MHYPKGYNSPSISVWHTILHPGLQCDLGSTPKTARNILAPRALARFFAGSA